MVPGRGDKSVAEPASINILGFLRTFNLSDFFLLMSFAESDAI